MDKPALIAALTDAITTTVTDFDDSTGGGTAPDPGQPCLDALAQAEADLQTVLDRLDAVLHPTPGDTTAPVAAVDTGDSDHPEVAGQPAPQ